jgi:hypothetical protein
MKRKLGLGIICMTGGIFLSSKAFGQSPFETASVTVFNPNFFIAILAGVLIALGFQLVLTNLSVAAGVTAIGIINKKDSTKKQSSHKEEEHTDKKSSKSKMPLGVLLSSAAGIWTMITAAISLFFASFFAVKLSLVPDNSIGVALGLVIWACFMMTMLYLESKAIGSLMGGIFNAAVRAVKAGFSGIGMVGSAVGSTVGSVFHHSETSNAKAVADHTIEKIRDEVYSMVSHSDLSTKFEQLINKLEPHQLDYDKLKDGLISLISDIRIHEQNGELPGERDIFLKVAEKQSNLSKVDVDKLGKFFDMAKSALVLGGAIGGVAGGVAGVSKLFHKTPKVEDLKEQVEDYMIRSGEAQFHPEILRAELDEIFHDQSQVDQIVSHKVQAFDKDYVATIVATRKGVSRDDALIVATKVEDAINNILRKANISEIASEKVHHMTDMVSDSIHDMTNRVTDNIIMQKDEIIAKVEDRIAEFFSRINRPEFDYNLLRSDIEAMIHNPKLAPEILKLKLKQLDGKALLSLFSKSGKFSKSESHSLVQKYEETKGTVLNKLDGAELEIKRRMHEAKEYGMEQAENTRKTAVAASWWLVGTFIVSGLAAVIGGMVSL